MSADQLVSMRHIRTNGAVYLRADDVVAYVRALGATEETDVRNRLEEAADAIRDCTSIESLRHAAGLPPTEVKP